MSRSLLLCLLVLLLFGLPTVPVQSLQAATASPARPTGDRAAFPPGHAGHRPGPDSTGTLVVHVVGLASNEGNVRIALTDADGYQTDDDLREATRPITDNRARWAVEAVPFGTYAVRLYHDENGNGELDTNAVGVPQEAYGFSNDARGRFGPPAFEAAAFTIDRDSLSLTITAE